MEEPTREEKIAIIQEEIYALRREYYLLTMRYEVRKTVKNFDGAKAVEADMVKILEAEKIYTAELEKIKQE